ncbi:hypothetical protein GQ42DRAFT_165816 [Ramicandelaber brevisporus]|nr:hypothetical protein GQ42DRAFT_165816 [Ramicandelaber brevisporus]
MIKSTDSSCSHGDAGAAVSPLFWLPIELLEEISQLFTRPESVQVLTVNSVLHEVFARRIWRNIGCHDRLIWEAPFSAWRRYGHLVRRLYIKSSCALNTIADLPGIVHLEVELSSASCRIFEQKLPQLNRLEISHTASYSPADGEGTRRAIDWVFAAEKRGQEVDVTWCLNAYSDEQWDWIDELVVLLKKSEYHSFILATPDYTLPFTFPLKHVRKLASMLSSLSFKYLSGDSATGYAMGILADNEIVFKKLRRVRFTLPSRELQDAMPLPSLLSSRFPVLKHIELSWSGNPISDLVHPFFHGSLMSVSSMRLYGCNDGSWNSIIGSVPNVRKLSLDACKLKFDVQVVAKQIPLLQKLSIYDGSGIDFTHEGKCRESAGATSAGQFLKLDVMEIWVHAYKGMVELEKLYEIMVNHAPSLRTVKIVGDTLTVPLSDKTNGAVNPPVKQLYFRVKSVAENDFEFILGLFPKLGIFEVDSPEHNLELLAKVRARYPHLGVLTTRSLYHWGSDSIHSNSDSDYEDDEDDDNDDFDDYDYDDGDDFDDTDTVGDDGGDEDDV